MNCTQLCCHTKLDLIFQIVKYSFFLLFCCFLGGLFKTSDWNGTNSILYVDKCTIQIFKVLYNSHRTGKFSSCLSGFCHHLPNGQIKFLGKILWGNSNYTSSIKAERTQFTFHQKVSLRFLYTYFNATESFTM